MNHLDKRYIDCLFKVIIVKLLFSFMYNSAFRNNSYS